MEEMLSFSLSYGDELWHVMLYQWLIDNALTDRLLEVRSMLLLIIILPGVEKMLGLLFVDLTSRSMV